MAPAELARTIADQFKGMTPEQMEAYARMAEMMQQEAGPSGAGGSPGAGFEAGSAKMQEMMNDPAMRSMAMSSLKNMTPDQFRSLSGALGKGMR